MKPKLILIVAGLIGALIIFSEVSAAPSKLTKTSSPLSPSGTSILSSVSLKPTSTKTSSASSGTVRGNTVPTLDANVSFTEWPYYEHSGMGNYLISGDTIFNFADQGINKRDLTDAKGMWGRFENWGTWQATASYFGTASLIADPSDTTGSTLYLCTGSTLSGLDEEDVDYRLGLDLAGIWRSDDSLDSVQRLNGGGSLAERFFGCVGRAMTRYVRDEIDATTSIERWWMMTRGHLFAFDTSQTLTVNGHTISKYFYFNSFLQGTWMGEVASDGSSITWTSIHKKPVYHDNKLVEYWEDLTEDDKYYEYKPQVDDDGNTTDKRSCYASTKTTTNDHECNYTLDGEVVEGSYDPTTCTSLGYAGNDCLEDENIALGTAVVIDPNNMNVLYTGYAYHPLFPHGGVFVGVKKSGATFTESDFTELTNPDTGSPLDVRDIIIDDSQTVTVSGKKRSKFIYIIGEAGVMRGTVGTDGKITLKSANTGLYPRDTMLADYRTTGSYDTSLCADTSSCGVYISMSRGVVGGKTYLALAGFDGLFYAVDDGSGSLDWKWLRGLSSYTQTDGSTWTVQRDGALDNTTSESFANNNSNWGGYLEGAIVDADRSRIVFTMGGLIYYVNIDDLADSDFTMHGYYEGMTDYGGNAVYDPIDSEHVAHISRLDGGYRYLKRDNKNKLDKFFRYYYTDVGLCINMYHVTDASGYATGDSVNFGSADYVRGIAYGNRVVFGKKSDGTQLVYLGAYDYDDYYEGGILRGEYNASTGEYVWKTASGEDMCVAVYPSWNATKNSCAYACTTPTDTDKARPLMGGGKIAVDPDDGLHLITIGGRQSDKVYVMYETFDGGDSWTLLDMLKDENGTSLASLGSVTDLLFDPQDSNILYTAYATYGVWKLDKTLGYFKLLAEPQLGATDSLPAGSSTKFTLGSASHYKTPTINDIDITLDADTGATQIIAAVSLFCDSQVGTYGYWPTISCTGENGGGAYAMRVGVDSTFTKLNKDADGDLKYFDAGGVAVAPANPDHIVVTGSDYDWSGGGNPDNYTSGIMYTTDGGTTWQAVSSQNIYATTVAAHPTDADKFIIGMHGVWELDLSATSSTESSTGSDSGTSTATSTGGTSGNPTPCADTDAVTYTGDVTIARTSDADVIADKCRIDGNVKINGSSLTNLSVLADVVEITGNLDIENNDALASLTGTEELASVDGYIWVGYNDVLTSVDGFPSLNSVGDLIIEENTVATGIGGFSRLQTISGKLAISNNSSLKVISEFPHLASISKDVQINGNDALIKLPSFKSLTSIGGYLQIKQNDALTALSGFEALETAGTSASDDFAIMENATLSRLDGFAKLTTVQNFHVQKNTLLPNNHAQCLKDRITVKYYSVLSYNADDDGAGCP